MAVVSEELKNELNKRSKEELLKIIVRFAKKNAEMNKILQFELVESDSAEDLLEDVKSIINSELYNVTGKIIQKQLAQAISNCINEINDFKKVTKSKYHEALALQELLNIIFKKYLKDFGTCWTVFDSKAASVAKRYFNLVVSLHEDYHVEFKDEFEKILKLVKKECSHFDSIYGLPKTFDEFLVKKLNSK